MMDYQELVRINKKATRDSQRNGTTPVVLWEDGEDRPTEKCRLIPFTGYRAPRGWKKVGDYFVDSSGFGRPGEPALTLGEFLLKVKVGNGYGIRESGQFQCYIDEFEHTATKKWRAR